MNENKTIEKEILEKLGKKRDKISSEEKEIIKRIESFQEGYIKRDLTSVKDWIRELLDENVQVIGTNSIYPGDFEWRTGHDAAIEMFENDWKHWGKLKMYVEHSEIQVDGDTSWAAIFATVTRFTREEENRTFEASKKRSIQRIKAIAEKEMDSTLAMYQIINDASSVLYQYEQSETFVWPIRITLGFSKKNEKWMIKQIHFSWPGRGFPTVRLIEPDK
ncbi:MAG: hypothetical protein FK733_09335 [Asgard group archaeon]|nr:hypothetical protein [Asgard group archaeon]